MPPPLPVPSRWQNVEIVDQRSPTIILVTDCTNEADGLVLDLSDDNCLVR